MRTRSTFARLVLAAVCGGAVLSAPIIAAPTATGAPCPGGAIADPITGVCWAQGRGSLAITGTGGVCLPGRLGLCMAALQNSPTYGANLVPNAPAGPNRVDASWP